MNNKQAELLASQTNAENPDNSISDSKPLIEKEPFPGTPFWLIGNQDNGYFLAMGQHKLSNNFNTKQQVREFLLYNQWDIILTMNLVIIQNEISKLKNQQQ